MGLPYVENFIILTSAVFAERSRYWYSVACVVCLSSVVCIVAKRCVLVTIDSLQEVVYEKSIDTKMNDFDLCLEVISRSRQPFRYIRC